MANGKHARLRKLNKINTTLKRKNKTATEHGFKKGVDAEKNRIINLPFFERIKAVLFKAA